MEKHHDRLADKMVKIGHIVGAFLVTVLLFLLMYLPQAWGIVGAP